MKPIYTIFLVLIVASVAFYVSRVYHNNQSNTSIKIGTSDGQFQNTGNKESEIPQSGDLCGGTGGKGQIVSVENNKILMKRNEGGNLIIHITNQTTIKTSNNPNSASESDLKPEDRITIGGKSNPDGSFNARVVVVCSDTAPTTQQAQ